MSITIPSDKIEAVREFLERIRLNEEKVEDNSDVDVCSEECEVEKILQHSSDGEGMFNFLVKFKYDPSPVWVPDNQCDCDDLIMKYFEENDLKVSTTYLLCRVSTKQQAGYFNVSLDAQEQELKRKAKLLNTNARIKTIKTCSSAYRDIPSKWSDIGDVCKSGDTIVIYRIDRLSRNIVKFMSWLEDLDERNVNIYSCAENITYREKKLDFLQGILDATKESHLLGERVKMSIAHRRARGDEGIGKLSYGKKYVRDSSGVLKVVDDVQAMQNINTIRNMIGKGISQHNIMKFMNVNGFLKNGKKWTVNMISYIVRKHDFVDSFVDSRSSLVKRKISDTVMEIDTEYRKKLRARKTEPYKFTL
jgi:DNA invertase Pin-like site-specific DNA recombinase